MSTFLGYLAIGVSAGLVYALLALGIVLIYKGSRVVNFAHPYFGLLAAFLCWWMASKASFAPFSWLPFGLNTRPRVVLRGVGDIREALGKSEDKQHGRVRAHRHAGVAFFHLRQRHPTDRSPRGGHG